ncbi:hypothetical protein DFQ30_004400, partial [Apophysomyces sp. BC1015]
MLTAGTVQCPWRQIHNYAQVIDRNTGLGGLSFFIRPDLPFHVHLLPITSPHTLSIKIGPYTLHGLYLAPHIEENDVKKLYTELSLDDNTLYLGDFNIRLAGRTGDARGTPQRRKTFEEWLDNNGLMLWNAELQYGVPTFDNGVGKSIIDYFISLNTNFLDPDLVIHSDIDLLRSDHHLCEFSFIPNNLIPPLPPTNAARKQWRLQRLEDPKVKERYVSLFTDCIAPALEDARHLLCHSHTPDAARLEDLVERMNESIYSSLEQSVGRAKPRPNSWKWFWTAELDQLVKERRRLYQRWRRMHDDLERVMAKHRYDDACAEFTKAVRATRAKTWKVYCDKIRKGDAVEMASAVKRMRLNRRTNVTLSSPAGPQDAANQMVNHLERVFRGSVPLRTTPEVTLNRNVVTSPWTLETVLEAI